MTKSALMRSYDLTERKIERLEVLAKYDNQKHGAKLEAARLEARRLWSAIIAS